MLASDCDEYDVIDFGYLVSGYLMCWSDAGRNNRIAVIVVDNVALDRGDDGCRLHWSYKQNVVVVTSWVDFVVDADLGICYCEVHFQVKTLGSRVDPASCLHK